MAAVRQNGFGGAHTRRSPDEDLVLDALDRYVLAGLTADFASRYGYRRARLHA